MTCVRRYVALVGLSALSLLLSACGHYKTDFACKGYPEGSLCLSTSDVYKRRHEQLTKMKKENPEESSSSSGVAVADRVSAVAGPAENHLGQPNITAPRVIQVWIAPWRDHNNFLHEASIVYAIVQQSDWTYGRAPKGLTRGRGGPSQFTPRLTHGMVEQAHGGNQRVPNTAQPVFAPPPAPTPQPSTQVRPQAQAPGLPQQSNGSQDPSVILRQLQQQVPSMSGPGGQDLSIEEQQERIMEQRERMGY
jgi:type IV conjugative transfer system lipoprotein TraV